MVVLRCLDEGARHRRLALSSSTDLMSSAGDKEKIAALNGEHYIRNEDFCVPQAGTHRATGGAKPKLFNSR